MINHARRHKEKCLAKVASGESEAKQNKKNKPAKPNSPVSKAKAKHTQDAASAELQNDLQRLSAIEDVQKKIELKKNELIPKYSQLVADYRESGANRPNEILVYLIIWLIDAERIEEALDLAQFAIEQQQSMPERFKRDLPTYVAEEIYYWAERQYKANQSAEPYFGDVVDLVHAEKWIITQVIVLTKLYKLRALFAEREENWQEAVRWFEACVAVNPEKHGVKTKLENAKNKLEKTASHEGGAE